MNGNQLKIISKKAKEISNEYYTKILTSNLLKSDKAKMRFLEKVDKVSIALRVVSKLEDDSNKIECLKYFQSDAERASILMTLKSDDKKIENFKVIVNPGNLLFVINSLSSDELKIKYLNLLEDDEDKIFLICSLSQDSLKESCLNIFAGDNAENYKSRIIASLGNDEEKKKYIEAHNNHDFSTVVSSLKNSYDKLNYIDLLDEYGKLVVIESLKEEDKIKYLDLLPDWHKVVVIKTLSEDKRIECIELVPEDMHKVEIIKTLSEDKKIECIELLSSDMYKVKIIKTLSEDTRIKYLVTVEDEDLKSIIIKDLENDGVKIEDLKSFKDEEAKLKIINSLKNESERIQCFKYLTSDECKLEVIKNLSSLIELDINMKRVISRYFLNKYGNNIDINSIDEEIEKFTPFFEKIALSNSIEIQNMDFTELTELYISDNSPEKAKFNEQFNMLEGIFLRNNLPPFVKMFMCFKSIYPNLSRNIYDKELFDFSKDSRLAPSLLDENITNEFKNTIFEKLFKTDVDKKFALILGDLFRASLQSNSFELKEYVKNLEIGNEIFTNIITNKKQLIHYLKKKSFNLMFLQTT